MEEQNKDVIGTAMKWMFSYLIPYWKQLIVSVLEKGKIVERGDHETLVKKGGIYTDLYETQMRV